MKLRRLLAYFARVSVDPRDEENLELKIADTAGNEYAIASVGFDAGTLTWTIRITPPKAASDEQS